MGAKNPFEAWSASRRGGPVKSPSAETALAEALRLLEKEA